MRKRAFRPAVESLGLRIAPTSAAVATPPENPLYVATDPSNSDGPPFGFTYYDTTNTDSPLYTTIIKDMVPYQTN